MASRMDKYNYNNATQSRSSKNESLYKDIYENARYSNIERVATLEKTNEINLEQIKELLKEREEHQKKNMAIKRETPRPYKKREVERNYDIRDVLIKAKDEKPDDNKNRSLRNTQYNILKKINLDTESELEKTLSNTNILQTKDDNELCLDLLSDLKSSGNTMVRTSTNLLKEVKEAKDKYEPQIETDENLDKSFYTSSLNFKEEDFEQLKDLQDSIDSNNKMIKVLFVLLFIIISAIITFIVLKFIK